ncbi:hypothetical protein Tco_1550607 [Tanacetum coccineum]
MNSELRVHHGLVSSVRLPSILLILLMLHSAAISLPLVGSDYGIILHVSVQLLTAKTGFRLRGSLEAAELSITELKMELSLLSRIIKRSYLLKSECSKLKTNLLVEDQIRNLQEKVYAGSHEPDLRVLKSDLEVLFNTVHYLKKETVKPEIMLPFSELPSPPLEKLLSKLDVTKSENENLVKKMNEMESYYEGLAQELEENQKRIMGEIQTLRSEHSACKAETKCLNSCNK